MNTTIAIVLPEWMAWMIFGVIVLAIVNDISSLYLKWLQRKLALLRNRADDHAA